MTTAVSREVAVKALWGNARLVAIDTETVNPPDGGPRRVVSIAAITCLSGAITGGWNSLVNPGTKVDDFSRKIHGLTDDDLLGAPSFAEVANTLLEAFTAKAGEPVIVVAHNITFDISVLRHEFTLLGMTLPDLPYIDTKGKLVRLAGLPLNRPALPALLAELGLVNPSPHEANADATACAKACVELLARTAERGHTDLDTVLATVSDSRTIGSIKASAKSSTPTRATAPVLPAAHLEGHATILSSRARAKGVAAWRDDVAECAKLRCHHLDDRVAQSDASPLVKLAQLENVLDERVAANDTAGAATVIGALLPLLQHRTPKPGRLGFRTTTPDWSKAWAPRLAPLKRCTEPDLCPACLAGDGCPLDTWFATVGTLALGDPDRYAKGFFEMNGREEGTGAFTAWENRRIDRRIIDAATWACVEHWRNVDQPKRAEQVVHLSWRAGCRHPNIAVEHALALATPGKLADLRAAVAVCDTALADPVWDGSTDESRTRLRTIHNLLAGRARRLTVRESGHLDEDGNPIPVRRHFPDKPHRTRPPRFSRT